MLRYLNVLEHLAMTRICHEQSHEEKVKVILDTRIETFTLAIDTTTTLGGFLGGTAAFG